MIIALTYAAAALAWVLRAPRSALRSAWTGGSLIALFVFFVGGLESFVAEYAVFALAISACANATWAKGSKVGAVATLALFTGCVPQPLWALGLIMGLISTELMMTNRGRAIRLACHWVSFVGTFAVLLPALLAMRERGSVTLAWPWVTALVAVFAVGLGAIASVSFYRAGGTPEPNDPPRELVSNGVYRFIRHPIQWAEILAVLSAAIALQSTLVWLYCAAFAAMLKGPMRWYEESRLEQRFGRQYSDYCAEVPAYLPGLKVRL